MVRLIRIIVFLISILIILASDVYIFDGYISDDTTDINSNINVKHIKLSTPARNETLHGILTTISSASSISHVFMGEDDHCDRKQTSKRAKELDCLFAINGGPFDMNTGACMGTVVSNDVIIQVNDTAGFASFGVSKTNNKLVFGDITSTIIKDNNLSEVISGFIGPLLIANNQVIESGSTLIAQRQAIGIDKDGRILFLTVDGAESQDRGMTINELGQHFLDLGAITALNLDGGGSTSTFYNGETINHTTCADYLIPNCERKVSNIICIKQ